MTDHTFTDAELRDRDAAIRSAALAEAAEIVEKPPKFPWLTALLCAFAIAVVAYNLDLIL